MPGDTSAQTSQSTATATKNFAAHAAYIEALARDKIAQTDAISAKTALDAARSERDTYSQKIDLQKKNYATAFQELTQTLNDITHGKQDDYLETAKIIAKNPQLIQFQQDLKFTEEQIKIYGEKYRAIDSEINQLTENIAKVQVALEKSQAALVAAKAALDPDDMDSRALIFAAAKDCHQLKLENYRQALSTQKLADVDYQLAKISALTAKDEIAAIAVKNEMLLAEAQEYIVRMADYYPVFNAAQDAYIQKHPHLINSISQPDYQNLICNDPGFLPYFLEMNRLLTEFSVSKEMAEQAINKLNVEKSIYSEKEKQSGAKESILNEANAALEQARIELDEASIELDAFNLEKTTATENTHEEDHCAAMPCGAENWASEKNSDEIDIDSLAHTPPQGDDKSAAHMDEEMHAGATSAAVLIGQFHADAAGQTAAAALHP